MSRRRQAEEIELVHRQRCRLAFMDSLITRTEKKAVIAVAVICLVVMFVIKLRLDYVVHILGR